MSADAEQRRFLELFLAEQDLLRAYVCAAVGGGGADELFQEVSGVLWEAFPRYDQAKPFRPWAIGVARMEILKCRQRHARRREVFSEALIDQLSHTAMEVQDDGRERRLAACLGRLPEPSRELLRRRYQEDLPIADLAAMTGRTIAAVEMALVRIKRALRECMTHGSMGTEDGA